MIDPDQTDNMMQRAFPSQEAARRMSAPEAPPGMLTHVDDTGGTAGTASFVAFSACQVSHCDCDDKSHSEGANISHNEHISLHHIARQVLPCLTAMTW